MDILKIKRVVPSVEAWEEPTTFDVEISVNMGRTVDISLTFDNASPADPHGPESTFKSRIAMFPISALQQAIDFARESQEAAYEIFGRDVPKDSEWEVTYKTVLKKSKPDLDITTKHTDLSPLAEEEHNKDPF